MHPHRPVILVTGFGPFPGAPRNASSLLAEALATAAVRSLPAYKVHAAALPTEWEAAPRRLAELVDEHDPVAAVHFGISRRARGFVVEMRARNLAANVCDARGAYPPAQCVQADGPDEIGATLPVNLIVERLRRLGLPVQLSRDAGDYLCNAILYHSLSEVRRRPAASGNLRRGFIHIPDRLLAGERRSGRPAAPSKLDWEGAVAGGLAILAACAGTAGAAAQR